MKKIVMVLLALTCAGVLLAKGPDAALKPAEDFDEAGVMIDSRSDMDDPAGSASVNSESAVPGGLPSAYGECKGVIADAGKNVLVLESSEDGTISFVQVKIGEAAVSWKLIGRIPRSAD